jgi:hypothetical protein
MLAWLRVVWPDWIRPSAETLSPGRTRMTSPICEVGDGDFFLGAVGAEAAGFGGGEFDEGFDGASGAVGGAGFDDFAEEHEEGDHAGFAVVAGGEGGDDGEGDEFVGGEAAGAEVLEGREDDGPAEHNRPEERADAGYRGAARQEEVHQIGVRDEYDAQQRPADPDGRMFVAVVVPVMVVAAATAGTMVVMIMVVMIMVVMIMVVVVVVFAAEKGGDLHGSRNPKSGGDLAERHHGWTGGLGFSRLGSRLSRRRNSRGWPSGRLARKTCSWALEMTLLTTSL